jgi:hypothetical protein
MFTHRVAPVLALLFAFFAHTAHAQLGPPYLTPAHPTPSDTIYVNVFGGPCDILDGGPLPPVITQQGSAITVVFLAHTTPTRSLASTPLARRLLLWAPTRLGPTRSQSFGATSTSSEILCSKT